MIVAEKLEEFKQLQEMCPDASERTLAELLNIPRTTLQHWQKRQNNIDEDPDVVAFFTSPAGVAFLHRLVIAAHFVMSFLGPCGVRLVCEFLELSGLCHFIASSYGAQRAVSLEMEAEITVFEEKEEARLSKKMAAKKICIAEDETYHERPCLVAIEPASNYILLEKYAEDRQAETWNEAVSEAIKDKPVEVIQSTSDEGRGIISHVENGMGAHHAPDVFHIQQEISRATSGSLSAKVRSAEGDVVKAGQGVRKQEQAKERYYRRKHGRGRPPNFDKRIKAAREHEQQTIVNLAKMVEVQKQAKGANRAIGETYHPYDLQTGAPQEAKSVDNKLNALFEELESIAERIELRESAQKKIAKAKRVVVKMVATIAFYWLTVNTRIEALELAADVEQAVFENLLPAYYLFTVAEKKKDARQRQKLKEKALQLLRIVQDKENPIQQLSIEERQALDAAAWECVNIFQPSSSCVEGRNGQLALRHHALHRLSDQKLNALKVVHNFYLQRPDGTTAAERFFGSAPRELFSHLLNTVNLPGFPARKRPYVKSKISFFTPENNCLA
jgi:DNA-binding transcriptional regulator YiaG